MVESGPSLPTKEPAPLRRATSEQVEANPEEEGAWSRVSSWKPLPLPQEDQGANQPLYRLFKDRCRGPNLTSISTTLWGGEGPASNHINILGLALSRASREYVPGSSLRKAIKPHWSEQFTSSHKKL